MTYRCSLCGDSKSVRCYGEGHRVLGIDYNNHPTNGATPVNQSTTIFLVSDNVRAVRVAYDTDEKNNNPGYLFKTFDATIAKDDLVVVPTTTRHGFTICKVVEVDCPVNFDDNTTQYKWIAGKFDPSQHKATLEQEQVIMDAASKAEAGRRRRQLAQDLQIDQLDTSGFDAIINGTATALPAPKAE